MIVTYRYDFNTTAWSFLGRDITPDAFSEIAAAIIVFLSLAHLVHWLADYSLQQKWFRVGEVSAGDVLAIGKFKDRVSILEAFNRRLSQLEQASKEGERLFSSVEESQEVTTQGVNDLKADFEKYRKEVSHTSNALFEVKDMLDSIGPRFKSMSLMTKFVLYFWYLFLPLSISAFSLYLLCLMHAAQP